MNEDSKAILKKYQVNLTRTRVLVMDTFLKAKEPLTRTSFYDKNTGELNRITIFRTLKLFLSKKIIYRVHATDRTSRYFLSKGGTTVHSNFICRVCKKVTPLQTIDPPEVELPDYYTQQNTEIIIEGICDECRRKELRGK